MIENSPKYWFVYVKSRILDYNLDSFIWLLNLGPKSAGFSILDEKRNYKFWLFHFTLVIYVYLTGSFHYQIVNGRGMKDAVKCIINLSIATLTSTSAFWFMRNRSLVKITLIEIAQSDKLAKSPETMDEYKKYMKRIKIMLIIFYSANIINAFALYYPSRFSFNNDLGMTPCVGMSLDSLPEQLLCRSLLIAQEGVITTTILNYQALLFFVFGHTYVTFSCLTRTMTFTDRDKIEPDAVTRKLTLLIERHVLILKIIHKLRCLYSMPIGVNFGANVLCVCFFFYVPLRECHKFLPVLTYCFSIFYVYCLLCQKLVDASEDFERAIYSCGWESFRVKERKIVYIMLLQAQKPVTVLAADIIPLNIYTFAGIVQNIYKFVTVVKL